MNKPTIDEVQTTKAQTYRRIFAYTMTACDAVVAKV